MPDNVDAWLAVIPCETVGVPEPLGDTVNEGLAVASCDPVPPSDALAVPVPLMEPVKV